MFALYSPMIGSVLSDEQCICDLPNGISLRTGLSLRNRYLPLVASLARNFPALVGQL